MMTYLRFWWPFVDLFEQFAFFLLLFYFCETCKKTKKKKPRKNYNEEEMEIF